MSRPEYSRPEMDAYLLKHYGSRASARDIGKVFGVSRSVITGRAYRLGLSRRKEPAEATSKPRHYTKPRKTLRDLDGPISELGEPIYREIVVPVQPIVVPKEPAKMAPRRLLRDAPPMSPWKECQWIEGADSSGPRCCAKTHRGSSWCETHYARVYASRREAA
jgi:hypothetical protein